MPLNPTPYDALKKLLGGSPDLNADDPSGMVGTRLRQEDVGKEMLRTAELSASNPRHSIAGSVPSDFADLRKTLGESPNFGDVASKRADDFQAANDSALQAGFRGDQEIAGPASGGDQMGEHLYANVGNRSGDSPAQMAGKSAANIAAMKAQMPLDVARTAAKGGVDQAAMEAKGKLDLEMLKRQGMQDSFKQFLKLRPGSMASHEPTGATDASTGATPPAGPPVKRSSQPWSDFILGRGPNALGGALDAFSERQKYGMMSTPMSDMIQNESFGNLEQLQAQFPGVRGFGYLLPKLKEHQSHFGQGLQTPQSSYDRLGNMTQILDELEQDMADPSSHMAQSAAGEWHFTATPAAAQRGLAAIHDTRKRFEDARAQLGQQYPELTKPRALAPATSQAPQPAVPGGGSRFERLPE